MLAGLWILRRDPLPEGQGSVAGFRDWELGRTEPDRHARAYLSVIARDPAAVARLLQPESIST